MVTPGQRRLIPGFRGPHEQKLLFPPARLPGHSALRGGPHPALARQRDPATTAAPTPRPPRGAAAAAGGHPPRDPDTAPRYLRLRARSRPPPPPSAGAARITWFISEEMEKLISGASTGSRRKRAGLGPTESASRPRRGERSSGGDGPQSAKAARRARDAGDSRGLARSPAQQRRSRRERHCAQQLAATVLHARPGHTAAATRSRRTPSHVTTCAAAAVAAAAASASRVLPVRRRRRMSGEPSLTALGAPPLWPRPAPALLPHPARFRPARFN